MTRSDDDPERRRWRFRDSGTDGADPWPDPLDGTSAPDHLAPATDADPPSDAPARSTRLGGPRIQVLIVVTVVLALVLRYGVMVVVEGAGIRAWASSSFVFVLGPALLAWLLSRTASRTTATGRVMAGTTMALLLVSTLLGEAALCVLLAAPLVYAIAAMIVVIRRRMGAGPAAAVLLLLLPVAELGAADPVERVRVTCIVAAGIEDVEGMVTDGPTLRPDRRPWLLRLGYPVPTSPTASVTDGRIVWTWRHGAGVSRFAMVGRSGGWDFDVIEDTAMRRWFAWEDASLDVRPVDRRTEMTLTLRFEPALGPDWYFGPIERAFMAAAGAHLLDGLVAPAGPSQSCVSAGRGSMVHPGGLAAYRQPVVDVLR